MSAIDKLLQNNAAYARGFTAGELPAAPAKRLAVLACMDARIDVYRILGLREGDAHVIRNAGGLVTEDALRSLLISQRVLGTEEIVLIHHTECGMLKLDEDELKQEVEEEVGTPVPFGLGAISDLEESVRASIAQIENDPLIPRTDKIRGFIYDVTSGRLRGLD